MWLFIPGAQKQKGALVIACSSLGASLAAAGQRGPGGLILGGSKGLGARDGAG